MGWKRHRKNEASTPVVADQAALQARHYPNFSGTIGRTMAESSPAPRPRPTPPLGAPNVIVVLVDDLGYSDIGCFGSEISTPHVDALAAGGLRYTNFHVAPICAPSRASLLTSLNPHAAGVGYVAGGIGYPGYEGYLDPNALTAGDVFRANGYATLMVGKWHLGTQGVDTWPLQRGFDRYYGVLAPLTDLHFPTEIVVDNQRMKVDEFPDGYYLTDDITDRAIEMIRDVKEAQPEQPFFLYFSHLAVHAPLMAKPDDVAQQRGRYDEGWDALRDQRFERQKQMGVVAPDTELPPPNHEEMLDARPWESLSDDARRLAARHMEVYSAMVNNVDQSLGRLCDALKELDIFDNTIILFTSDNGASREGGSMGTTEYYRTVQASFQEMNDESEIARDLERIDLLGSPQVMSHYPRSWAMACNTPFRMYKGTTFAAGHQVPLVVSWPKGLRESGGFRRQYVHMTDMLPTWIELIGLKVPDKPGARPMFGTSFAATLFDPDAPSTHFEQYQEVGGHRGFLRDGWEAVTIHYPRADFATEAWQLFDMVNDPTQTRNLAAVEPERLRDLVKGFDSAAWEHQIYPLVDWAEAMELVLKQRAGNGAVPPPVRLTRRDYTSNRAIGITIGRAFTVTIRLNYTIGDEGILVAHGGQGGGFVVYIENGECVLAHNPGVGIHHVSTGPLAGDVREIIAEFSAPGVGSRRTARLLMNGAPATEWAEVLLPGGLGFSGGANVGRDRGSPVSWELYERKRSFIYTGDLVDVTYRAGVLDEAAARQVITEQIDTMRRTQ